MLYPCKKQSCMGQTHTALKTGAKSTSVLLSEQLTQINNYQTEGLLVHIFFSLWHLLCWPSTAARPAPAPDLDGAAVIPSSLGWRWAQTGSPSFAPKICAAGTLWAHSAGPASTLGLWEHPELHAWRHFGMLPLEGAGKFEGIHCAAGTLWTAE